MRRSVHRLFGAEDGLPLLPERQDHMAEALSPSLLGAAGPTFCQKTRRAPARHNCRGYACLCGRMMRLERLRYPSVSAWRRLPIIETPSR
jgi:hypothetical protein